MTQCVVSEVCNVDIALGLRLCKVTFYLNKENVSFSAQLCIESSFQPDLTLKQVRDVCIRNLRDTVIVDNAVYATLKGTKMNKPFGEYVASLMKELLCSL